MNLLTLHIHSPSIQKIFRKAMNPYSSYMECIRVGIAWGSLGVCSSMINLWLICKSTKIPILVLLQISHSTDIEKEYPRDTLSFPTRSLLKPDPNPSRLTELFLRSVTLMDGLFAKNAFWRSKRTPILNKQIIFSFKKRSIWFQWFMINFKSWWMYRVWINSMDYQLFFLWRKLKIE